MTESEKYNVILNPHIRLGYERDIVIKSFAELLKVPQEKARAVIGKKRILQKELDRVKAENIQKKLKSIGLDVVLEKVYKTPPKMNWAKPERSSVVSAKVKIAEPKKVKTTRAGKPVLKLVPTDMGLAKKPANKSKPVGKIIICPKCQLKQTETEQCSGCGVFLSNIRANSQRQQVTPAVPVQPVSLDSSRATASPNEQGSASIKNFLLPAAAAVLGALLWKFVAVTFNYELGLIAWLIGGAIGFAAVMAGARGQQAAMVCALLAIMAIVGGKYMATVSFISEASAAISTNQEINSMDLKSFYEKTQADAVQFSTTVTDDASLRDFIVQRGYSDSEDAASVTDEEIAWFKQYEQPGLEEMMDTPQSFEQWKNDNLAKEIENLSPFEMMMDDLGLLDFLFLILGVGTAYRLGMGND